MYKVGSKQLSQMHKVCTMRHLLWSIIDKEMDKLNWKAIIIVRQHIKHTHK